MSSLRQVIRRHPVVTYVALAWGLSWAYWIPMALRGEIVTPGGAVSHFPGLLGPMVAAVIVTVAVEGRAGILDFGARLVRWRVPVRWYLLAILPYVLFLAAFGLVAATGGDPPAPDEFYEFSGLPNLTVLLVVALVLLFNGFGEEAGWRGFLTPQLLRRHGPILASVLVAAAWIAWHVPSFWVIETYRNAGVGIVPMMAIGITAGSIILTWLYIGSGGSILIVALWHLAYNFGSATTAGRGIAGAVLWTAVLLWALIVIVGWLVAAEPRTRSFMSRLRDGTLVSLLRSPVGRLMPGLTVIGFQGRRSGRRLQTPVECVREAGHLYVLVGHAEAKQWWRNVQASPEVTVEVDGHDLPGLATVHVGSDEGAGEDLTAYLRHRPRTARALGLSPQDPKTLNEAAGQAHIVSVRVDLLPTPVG